PGAWEVANVSEKSGDAQTAPVKFGETVFSLMRLQPDGGTVRGEWWLYADPDALPTADPTGSRGGAAAYTRFTTDAAELPGLQFGGFGYQMAVDELRGATTFEEAVPMVPPRLSHVLILPSTRKKTLTLNLELNGVRKAGEVEVRAEVTDLDGAPEKTFTGTARVEPRARQTVPITWEWENPRLWDIGQPNLYKLRLSLKSGAGVGIDTEYATPFGFREVWTEGRKIYLNGREFRFRPINFGWGGGPGDLAPPHDKLREYAALGFNLAEVWPGKGNFHDMNKALATAADELGFGVAGAAPFIENEGEAAYLQKLEDQIGDLRNHPSILFWGSSGNAYLNAADQDPRLVGNRNWTHVQEMRIRNQTGMEYLDLLKAYDPTRPTFTHAGNYVGDLYTLNNYLAMIPLQEREDWLSDWARDGRMPLFMVEFGTPLFTSYLRGRSHYGESIVTEPFSTEWAAAYFGPEAYRLESEAYRQAIRAKFKEGQHYEMWRNEKAMLDDPAFVAHQTLFITNTWRSWRTWGIPGGMIPWEDANGHLELVKPVNGPTLAWIAGPEKQFTDKTHNYKPGAVVEKSAVVIHDGRTPALQETLWEATLDGERIASGRYQGNVGVSETRFFPIRFELPSTAKAGKGRITVTATVAGERHEDAFDFRVIPAPKPSKGTLTVFDPFGETTAMLKALGYAVKPLNVSASKLPQGTVVVGRRALSGKDTLTQLGHLPFDVAAFVRGGGRLVVMGQDPRWIPHALGIRTAEYLTRNVFPLSSSAPVMDGLEPEDFSNWSGSSTLTRSGPSVGGVEPWFTPAYGWHWGNRGAVSSAPLEKPHRTSWRPLLETEFDLAYSPLMEMEHGRGRMILSTLDLEDHYRNDPAARKLASNLMRYATTAPVPPKART
ncbi:MAG: hypothetical protein KY468_20440, partial [Armatimonadetes bacterium]|nr:hypothetical protein [Armatimonadota bacterium]